jgi:aerobic carbon-monoxide dehydrogenase medium subunit
MIPGEFDYHAPKTVDEAVALLTKHEDAKILAGGQSLIPAMRFRLANPAVLIDINGIQGLEYIKDLKNHLAIGAMTRESALEESDVIHRNFPMLFDAARVIADPLVRNRATVGGNIAHADPANDHPAVMLAYNATVIAQGPNGTRQIDIDRFFVDIFTSALEHDEVLTEIRLPQPHTGSGGAYLKIERKVGDYATSGVAVQLSIQNGICEAIRIGLTNVSPVPMRATDAEKVLKGQAITEDLLERAGQAAAAQCEPNADLRGSVDYKRDLTRVLLKRTVRKAVSRAAGA